MQVKYITVKYEYRQTKIVSCSFHSYPALVQESWKAAPFYNGYECAKKNVSKPAALKILTRTGFFFLSSTARIPVVEEGWCDSCYICPLSPCGN